MDLARTVDESLPAQRLGPLPRFLPRVQKDALPVPSLTALPHAFVYFLELFIEVGRETIVIHVVPLLHLIILVIKRVVTAPLLRINQHILERLIRERDFRRLILYLDLLLLDKLGQTLPSELGP